MSKETLNKELDDLFNNKVIEAISLWKETNTFEPIDENEYLKKAEENIEKLTKNNRLKNILDTI